MQTAPVEELKVSFSRQKTTSIDRTVTQKPRSKGKGQSKINLSQQSPTFNDIEDDHINSQPTVKHRTESNIQEDDETIKDVIALVKQT